MFASDQKHLWTVCLIPEILGHSWRLSEANTFFFFYNCHFPVLFQHEDWSVAAGAIVEFSPSQTLAGDFWSSGRKIPFGFWLHLPAIIRQAVNYFLLIKKISMYFLFCITVLYNVNGHLNLVRPLKNIFLLSFNYNKKHLQRLKTV